MRRKNRSGRWKVPPTGHKKGGGIQGIRTASAAGAEMLFDALSTRLGKHPIHYNKHFLDFMNRNAVEWEHNKIQLQSAFSTVCGQYCIYFLYHRCRKRSMSSIVNSFVNDKLHNDQLVYDFVRRKYRQVHPSLKQDIDFVVKQISRSLYRE